MGLLRTLRTLGLQLADVATFTREALDQAAANRSICAHYSFARWSEPLTASTADRQ